MIQFPYQDGKNVKKLSEETGAGIVLLPSTTRGKSQIDLTGTQEEISAIRIKLATILNTNSGKVDNKHSST